MKLKFKHNTGLILTGILIFILLNSVNAAEIQVRASIDTANYLIGDWIPLKVEAIHPQNVVFFPPDVGEKAGDLDIVKIENFQPVVSKDQVHHQWNLILAAYDTGKFEIPAIELRCHTAGDTAISAFKTEPLQVYIAGAGGDTLKAPHDIKPPVSAPLEFADFLPFIILIAWVGFLVLAIWWWKKYRKPREKAIEEVKIPRLDPYDYANKRFVELENKKLWERGFVKEYWSELTEIVREYLENAFIFNALEMTTDELFEAGDKLGLFREEGYRELFRQADWVKFAKFIPAAEDCIKAMKTAGLIVRQAKQLTIPLMDTEAVL